VLELYDMFLALGYPVTVEKVSEVLQLVDADGNGNLSFKEFVALIVLLSNEEQQQSEGASGELSEEDQARFRALFASVDTDGSGSISTSELGNLFSNEGYDTSEEEMCALISLVDIDQDGVLNFEEFVQLILLYLESKQQQQC
jgi:Ca2+-binding EF-hand superfamily protein